MMYGEYEAIIGIECHVQLKTATKLFCGCNNDSRDAEPNTNVCEVCLALPGTLPVLNRKAVELALRAGVALNGKLGGQSKFDRKNYFYPDLPKGYQITQFDQPIVGEGYVEFPHPEKPGELFRVGITRAHMEEDAGKLTHPDGADYSLVDLNRAGTPLIEIVSEPDIRSAAQAKAYAQELYNLMRYADVSEANLYYGNMRFDVNVSVHKPGTEFGTRTETKNLNSFKAVERAAEYEIARQIERVEAGDKIVQETRGWNDAKQETFSQRSKEEAHDYRYFPEPDLPPLDISDEMIDRAKAAVTVLPNELRKDFAKIGLPFKEAEVLVASPTLVSRFMTATKGAESNHAKRIALWLINELPAHIESLSSDVVESQILPNPSALFELSKMVEAAEISATNAKAVLAHLVTSPSAPRAIAEAENLLQVSDDGEIDRFIDEAMAANPQSVADFREGKEKALGAIVGAVMKASKGQANPGLVNARLRDKIKT